MFLQIEDKLHLDLLLNLKAHSVMKDKALNSIAELLVQLLQRSVGITIIKNLDKVLSL